MKEVFFSIIIPTYNSEKTLSLCLSSILEQDLGSEDYEIIVVDGGSTDATLDIALKYGAKVLQNQKRLPEYAKEIGILNAKGVYIIFHDSDEILLSRTSFSTKKKLLLENPNIYTVVCSGCINPQNYSAFGDYSNLIGDSFTAFVYSWSPESNISRYKKQYYQLNSSNEFIIFSLSENSLIPIIDAAGHTFPRQSYNGGSVSTISTNNIGTARTFAVTINDYIEHYSSSSLYIILIKIRFRIINNVFGDMHAGYSNRESKIPLKIQLRKYFFLIYGLSIIFPFIKGIIWSIKTRNAIFLYEVIFAFTTVIMIFYYKTLKVFGKKRLNTSY